MKKIEGENGFCDEVVETLHLLRQGEKVRKPGAIRRLREFSEFPDVILANMVRKHIELALRRERRQK